jgi:hypothetical protein
MDLFPPKKAPIQMAYCSLLQKEALLLQKGGTTGIQNDIA